MTVVPLKTVFLFEFTLHNHRTHTAHIIFSVLNTALPEYTLQCSLHTDVMKILQDFITK